MSGGKPTFSGISTSCYFVNNGRDKSLVRRPTENVGLAIQRKLFDKHNVGLACWTIPQHQTSVARKDRSVFLGQGKLESFAVAIRQIGARDTHAAQKVVRGERVIIPHQKSQLCRGIASIGLKKKE